RGYTRVRLVARLDKAIDLLAYLVTIDSRREALAHAESVELEDLVEQGFKRQASLTWVRHREQLHEFAVQRLSVLSFLQASISPAPAGLRPSQGQHLVFPDES